MYIHDDEPVLTGRQCKDDRHNSITPTAQACLRCHRKKFWEGIWRRWINRSGILSMRGRAEKAEKYLVWKGGEWETEMALQASQKQEMTLWCWMTDDRWGRNSYKTLKANTIYVWSSREKGRCKKIGKLWARKAILAAPFAKAKGRNAMVIEM